MHEMTQGILSVNIALFMAVQEFLIESAVDEITPKIIREVAESEFKTIMPMIMALRLGDWAAISMYDDLIVDFDLARFSHLYDERLLTEVDKIDDYSMIVTNKEVVRSSMKDLIYEYELLRTLTVSEIEKIIDSVMKKNPGQNTASYIELCLKDAITLSRKRSKEEKSNSVAVKRKFGLLSVLEKSIKDNISVSVLLEAEGYITDVLSDCH